MIFLKNSTFAKIERAMKYPSITGGLGVRVDKQPGGGLSLNIPPVSDGGGMIVGGPGGDLPDDPYVEPPWVPPSDPYQPSSTS
jgi:hypothetical protein